MRPTYLRISGFGPYAGLEEVDLGELAAHGLYLIHGPTGAGKTSLLDALCFALYGEVPGARGRHAKQGELRSQHAELGTPTFVELDFEAHGEQYRIRRSPDYERPRKVGTGTTIEAAAHHLFKLEGPEAKTVADSRDEVNREVRELVGLDAAQFAQVIVLPQGRFEQVLQSDSKQRQDLLESLFDTEVFAGLERWLADRSADATKDLEGREARLVELARGVAARLAEVTGDEVAAPMDVPGLTDLVERARVGADRAAAAVAAAVDHHEATARAAVDLRARLTRFDTRAELVARRAELLATAAVVDERRRRLGAAERAEPVRTGLADAGTAGAAAARARRAVEAAREEVGGFLRRTADPVLVSLEGAGTDLRHAAVSRRAGLAAQVATAEDRRRHLGEAATEREAAERVAAELAAHTSRLTELAERKVTLRMRLETAREAVGAVPGAAAAAAELERRAEAAELLVTASARRAAADRAAVAAVDTHQRAVDELQQARHALLEGMAAELAAELEPGVACAVCGSTDHPAPARPAPGAVDRAVVAELDRRAATTERRRHEAAAAAAEARAEVERLEERAGPEADPDQLRAGATAARRHERELRTAAAEVAALESGLATIDEAEHGTGLARTGAESVRARHLAAAAAAEGAAAALGDDHTPDAGALRQAVARIDELLGVLRTVDRAEREAAELAAVAAQADDRLARDLHAHGWPDAAAARAALIDDDERTGLARAVDAHDAALRDVEVRLAGPDLAGLPEERPDADAAEAAAAAAGLARDAAVATAEAWTSAAEATAALAAGYADGTTALTAARAVADRLRSVADTVNGRSGNRVSLSRWVLAAYLEDVCVLANQRLRTMTGGRYQLQVLTEGGAGNRSAGLDLRVLDAHTGATRKVSTLSGGETFQASLALALAVGDAVGHQAGGVHVQCLFVDEGFGTLDPDALELALDELDALRAGGRSVGVISHVAALRERIRAGIEVEAGERGSHVRSGLVRP
ncbi:MAG: AAA family ATPase [Microthrixaceae bacterium]